jgi:pyridoxal phosphate enzyme (YggS family)
MDATLAQRLQTINERVARAAERVGRGPGSITLVGVTKFVPPEAIQEAIDCGLRHIGENRVQEAVDKHASVHGRACWHMVGHLQRNKVRPALGIFDVVESLDSERLAAALSREAEQRGKVVEVLIEVNTSGEGTKYGLAPQEVGRFIRETFPLPGLRLRGLMTVGPLVEDPEEARPAFRMLRALAEETAAVVKGEDSLGELSMGMTGDFETAIEEGSTIVRIGTGIFGPRPTGAWRR